MTTPRNQLKRQLAPGLWEDMDGNPHLSIPDFLAFAGFPDTPENRDIVTKMFEDMIRQKYPDAKIVLREKPD